jgi:hypothetical protein
MCNCGAGFDFLVFTSGVWLDIAFYGGLGYGKNRHQCTYHSIISYPSSLAAESKMMK